MAQEEKFCATCEKAVKGGKAHEVCGDCMRKLKLVPPQVVVLTDSQAVMIGVVQGLVEAGINYFTHRAVVASQCPCSFCSPSVEQKKKE